MKILESILKKLLTEEVSVDEINDAIDNHKRVVINYRTKGEDKNTGARVIEVYAYGLTKAGNPCIRCFQPFGDTTSRIPSWKFFRLDRITNWKPTKQTFDHPADDDYSNIGEFNPNGDETMSIVYKVASFGTDLQSSTQNTQPKTNMDVLKNSTKETSQSQKDATNDFKNIKDNGPKTNTDVYKTDTERGMERLLQQLKNNPQKIDLSKFEQKPKQKSKEEQQKDLEKLRQTLSDKPITLSDLNKKLNDNSLDSQETNTNSNRDKLYKTDTERGMERLLQQLKNNPQKIDLSKIPKR